MTYMATRLVMAMAAWLSIVSTILTPSLITAGDPRNPQHRASSYESTNVFDLHTHSPSRSGAGDPTDGFNPHFYHAPTNVFDGGRDGGSFAEDFSSRCPPRCACFGETVDCARRGLTSMPKGVPPETQRLDLQGNDLTVIYDSDLANLRRLRILQLHDNNIHTIQAGSFRDLHSLERIKLDGNKLRHLPDGLFLSCPSLYKLDLSHNRLKILGAKLFSGLTGLRYLQMDGNLIRCIDEQAFRGLTFLEILTMKDNNITTLWSGTFDHTPRLRALRISGNQLICDCQLAWFGRWLSSAPHLAPYIRCSSPNRLRDRILTDVAQTEFKCAGLVSSSAPRECTLSPVCPRGCLCGQGIVDCRDTGQKRVPTHIPDDTIELRLEHNEITEVPSKAFATYRLLKRIDLSNNEIATIADDAFQGLRSLNSIVLYGNQITSISEHVFRGLTSLQLLLLNANKIECVHVHAFKDLVSLNLLSLYDNNIKTMSNGTFSSMHIIHTMHLGQNPFVCDCQLAWLPEYLSDNPVETSNARCGQPLRLNKKPIGKMRPDSFKCTEELSALYSGRCALTVPCPLQCSCEGGRVDCSGRSLSLLPQSLPQHTTHLDLSYNQLHSVAEAVPELPRLQHLDLSHNRLSVLPLALLRAVPDLRSLVLSDNHISCVSQRAVQRLPHLQSLELTNNPITCDCRSAWLSAWLSNHSSPAPPPTCRLPPDLRDLPIPLPADLLCPASPAGDCEGDAVRYCPPECQCEGSIVRCSRAGLVAIPRGIPYDTTELYLDVNEIKGIDPERIHHLKALKRLDLSNNQITILSNKTFSELTELSTLIVSFNKLGCVERDALFGLSSLRILSLHGNDVSFIPEGTFRDLSSDTHVALGNNPLYCDCSMAWLAKFVNNDQVVEPGIARCADPRPMRDKLVLTTPPESFVCDENERVPDEVLAKCDQCYTRPCDNGGACRSLPGRQFECICSPGYYGDLCQHRIDACYGNPCDNGGTCKVYEMGRYACHCSPGFVGVRCEENVNDCVEHRCAHGTCVDGIDSYRCVCSAGFTGEFCDEQITFCTKEHNPCKNGAECVNQGTAYECRCTQGWSGDNCTVNVDDCANHLCQNGGQCVDGLGTYECKCVGDWVGRYCERGPSVLQQTEPCLQHDCRHGVCTVLKGRTDYACKCQSGYSGKYCEFLTSVNLVDKGSFLQLTAPPIVPSLNVTLTFISEVTDGVLAYLGHERQHLAVEIFRGRLRISYDVGNHPASNMFSYELISDGKEHTVELVSAKKNFTLRVDRGLARSVVNDGEHSALNTDGSPLYLGGVPPEVGRLALDQWHLRNSTSFRGCVKSVQINGRVQDLSRIQKQNKVVPGCGTGHQHDEAPVLPSLQAPKTGASSGASAKAELRTDLQMLTRSSTVDQAGSAAKNIDIELDVCSGHQCDNGRCKPRKRRPGYRCRCKRGWGGKFCNKAPSCRRESESAHLFDSNRCRSARPVRQYSCAGGCGRLCCRPKRHRIKKVTMICNDGTKYTKVIKILRKCTCTPKCESLPEE